MSHHGTDNAFDVIMTSECCRPRMRFEARAQLRVRLVEAARGLACVLGLGYIVGDEKVRVEGEGVSRSGARLRPRALRSAAAAAAAVAAAAGGTILAERGRSRVLAWLEDKLELAEGGWRWS